MEEFRGIPWPKEGLNPIYQRVGDDVYAIDSSKLNTFKTIGEPPQGMSNAIYIYEHDWGMPSGYSIIGIVEPVCPHVGDEADLACRAQSKATACRPVGPPTGCSAAGSDCCRRQVPEGS
jgi:hypothetical protein